LTVEHPVIASIPHAATRDFAFEIFIAVLVTDCVVTGFADLRGEFIVISTGLRIIIHGITTVPSAC
jgi:hypothetical protein